MSTVPLEFNLWNIEIMLVSNWRFLPFIYIFLSFSWYNFVIAFLIRSQCITAFVPWKSHATVHSTFFFLLWIVTSKTTSVLWSSVVQTRVEMPISQKNSYLLRRHEKSIMNNLGERSKVYWMQTIYPSPKRRLSPVSYSIDKRRKPVYLLSLVIRLHQLCFKDTN